MKELELQDKSKSPSPKPAPSHRRTPAMEQLNTMTTDDLVKLLMSPDMAKPMHQPLRQLVIQILQQREGNAFVQRALVMPSDKR